MFTRSCTSAILCAALTFAGCLSVGQASTDELAMRDAWGKQVSTKDRAEVQREVDQHTDWMEKKKVQWMTMQYRARYNRARAKAAAAAATRPATSGPSTAPATSPA